MRKASIVYYLAAAALLVFCFSLALPFLKNLLPGFKLIYSIFPIAFILLTHYRPSEIVHAFELGGRRSRGTRREYENAILFFKTMQQLFIALMLLGVPILFIWLLAGPQGAPAQIAHVVAILIGAFLYPLLFILFICLPWRSALQKKWNEAGEET